MSRMRILRRFHTSSTLFVALHPSGCTVGRVSSSAVSGTTTSVISTQKERIMKDFCDGSGRTTMASFQSREVRNNRGSSNDESFLFFFCCSHLPVVGRREMSRCIMEGRGFLLDSLLKSRLRNATEIPSPPPSRLRHLVHHVFLGGSGFAPPLISFPLSDRGFGICGL